MIKILYFLVNKMTKHSNNRPLTLEERNQIYNEIIFGLMGMKVYKYEQITVWDLEDPELKRFKIMLKLFRDHGKEFSGEFTIQTMKRKMIYNLHNNYAKKTTAYISKYKPIERKKPENQENQTNETAKRTSETINKKKIKKR